MIEKKGERLKGSCCHGGIRKIMLRRKLEICSCTGACACVCTFRAVLKHPPRLRRIRMSVTAVIVTIKLSNHFLPDFAISWQYSPIQSRN